MIKQIYEQVYDYIESDVHQRAPAGAYTASSAAAFIKAFDAAKQHYTDLSLVATANRTDKNNPYADIHPCAHFHCRYFLFQSRHSAVHSQSYL